MLTSEVARPLTIFSQLFHLSAEELLSRRTLFSTITTMDSDLWAVADWQAPHRSPSAHAAGLDEIESSFLGPPASRDISREISFAEQPAASAAMPVADMVSEDAEMTELQEEPVQPNAVAVEEAAIPEEHAFSQTSAPVPAPEYIDEFSTLMNDMDAMCAEITEEPQSEQLTVDSAEMSVSEEIDLTEVDLVAYKDASAEKLQASSNGALTISDLPSPTHRIDAAAKRLHSHTNALTIQQTVASPLQDPNLLQLEHSSVIEQDPRRRESPPKPRPTPTLLPSLARHIARLSDSTLQAPPKNGKLSLMAEMRDEEDNDTPMTKVRPLDFSKSANALLADDMQSGLTLEAPGDHPRSSTHDFLMRSVDADEGTASVGATIETEPATQEVPAKEGEDDTHAADQDGCADATANDVDDQSKSVSPMLQQQVHQTASMQLEIDLAAKHERDLADDGGSSPTDPKVADDIGGTYLTVNRAAHSKGHTLEVTSPPPRAVQKHRRKSSSPDVLQYPPTKRLKRECSVQPSAHTDTDTDVEEHIDAQPQHKSGHKKPAKLTVAIPLEKDSEPATPIGAGNSSSPLVDLTEAASSPDDENATQCEPATNTAGSSKKKPAARRQTHRVSSREYASIVSSGVSKRTPNPSPRKTRHQRQEAEDAGPNASAAVQRRRQGK